MSKKAKEYSPEFKFKIVKELLRQESTQTEISQREGKAIEGIYEVAILNMHFLIIIKYCILFMNFALLCCKSIY